MSRKQAPSRCTVRVSLAVPFSCRYRTPAANEITAHVYVSEG